MSKFKIPILQPTTNKTIRMPNDVVEAVEKAIQGKSCTFFAASRQKVPKGIFDGFFAGFSVFLNRFFTRSRGKRVIMVVTLSKGTAL